MEVKVGDDVTLLMLIIVLIIIIIKRVNVWCFFSLCIGLFLFELSHVTHRVCAFGRR